LDIRLNWVTPSQGKANIDTAAEAAKNAGKAIVFVWQESSNETLNLEQCQDELIYKVAQANPNTIVVINSGDPIAMPWIDHVKGIVEMWYPGQDGGRATANILLGKANPGGKLPVTFPKSIEDVPAHTPGHKERQPDVIERTDSSIAYFSEGVNQGYRWYEENGIEPLFAFGHGLSYTTFKYSDLNIAKDTEGNVDVKFTLTNTGKVYGSEAPQVYIKRPDHVPEGVQFSPKLLGGFVRVDLKAGESKVITIEVDKQRFCYWDVDTDDWAIPEGEREIMVASSSRDIRLTGTTSY
jgi:beta-glucosidase